MKKIIGLGIVVALLLALPLAHTAMAKDHKVAICHFDGHEGDFMLGGAGGKCNRLDGNILSVAWQGACNGHGIEAACRD